MIYLDSCALVKLVAREPETPALRAFLSAHAAEAHITSALARVEVVRAVRHLGEPAVLAARELLTLADQLALSEDLLDTAADADPAILRSVDAIHLATAASLGEALTAFVTYDKHLAAAAVDAGLPLHSPS